MGCTRSLQECKTRTMLERPGSKLPWWPSPSKN